MTNGKALFLQHEVQRLVTQQSSMGMVLFVLIKSDLDKTKASAILSPIMSIPEGNARYRKLFFDAFCEAIRAGDYERVKRMNELRPFGMNERLDMHSLSTPVHVAAYWGRTEIVKLLLENPDYIHGQRNAAGYTPAELALAGGAPKELSDLLVDLECEDFLKRLEALEPPLPKP